MGKEVFTENEMMEDTVSENTGSFESFGVREELLKAIERKGFTSPTPVQQKVLEAGCADGDLIVRAKTG